MKNTAPNNRVDPTADLHVSLTEPVAGPRTAVGHSGRSAAALAPNTLSE